MLSTNFIFCLPNWISAISTIMLFILAILHTTRKEKQRPKKTKNNNRAQNSLSSDFMFNSCNSFLSTIGTLNSGWNSNSISLRRVSLRNSKTSISLIILPYHNYSIHLPLLLLIIIIIIVYRLALSELRLGVLLTLIGLLAVIGIILIIHVVIGVGYVLRLLLPVVVGWLLLIVIVLVVVLSHLLILFYFI